MKINGLNTDQLKLMQKVNERHKKCVGAEYKAGMEITEAWLDENENVCVRLKNGEWYHYYRNGTWG